MLAEFSPSLGAICAKQVNDTASINAFVACRATGGLSLNEGTYRCRFNLATTYVSSNTRINEDYNKLFFTIMDFKQATALFPGARARRL